MTRLSVPVHAFRPDGIPDYCGDQSCIECGRPARNTVHDLPDTPADAHELDARRLGEKTDTDQETGGTP